MPSDGRAEYKTPVRAEYQELRTDRLHLRRPSEADATAVFESFGADPEVTRCLAWYPHQSIADAEAALTARLERLGEGIEYWLFGVSCGSFSGQIRA